MIGVTISADNDPRNHEFAREILHLMLIGSGVSLRCFFTVFIMTTDLTLSCKGELPAHPKRSEKMSLPLQCNSGTATAEVEFTNGRANYGRLFLRDGKSVAIGFEDHGIGYLLGVVGSVSAPE
jgi:hypothetical protein